MIRSILLHFRQFFPVWFHLQTYWGADALFSWAISSHLALYIVAGKVKNVMLTLTPCLFHLWACSSQSVYSYRVFAFYYCGDGWNARTSSEIYFWEQRWLMASFLLFSFLFFNLIQTCFDVRCISLKMWILRNLCVVHKRDIM